MLRHLTVMLLMQDKNMMPANLGELNLIIVELP
jgi:hypothetical protein